MITPRSPPSSGVLAAIAAAARRMTLNVPIKLIFIMRWNTSNGCGPSLPNTLDGAPTPAQFNAPFRLPKLLIAVAMAAFTSASLVTSALAKRACAPSCLAKASPCAAFTSTSTTFPPPLTMAWAVAAPSPEPPPVITNVLFGICIIELYC